MDKYYLNKYLKYKNKYSSLKRILKGGNVQEINSGTLMKYKLDILNYAFFAKFAYATYDDFLCFLRAMIYNYLITIPGKYYNSIFNINLPDYKEYNKLYLLTKNDEKIVVSWKLPDEQICHDYKIKCCYQGYTSTNYFDFDVDLTTLNKNPKFFEIKTNDVEGRLYGSWFSSIFKIVLIYGKDHELSSIEIPPESIPPESIPPESIPPESIPPESIPPESIPPESIANDETSISPPVISTNTIEAINKNISSLSENYTENIETKIDATDVETYKNTYITTTNKIKIINKKSFINDEEVEESESDGTITGGVEESKSDVDNKNYITRNNLELFNYIKLLAINPDDTTYDDVLILIYKNLFKYVIDKEINFSDREKKLETNNLQSLYYVMSRLSRRFTPMELLTLDNIEPHAGAGAPSSEHSTSLIFKNISLPTFIKYENINLTSSTYKDLPKNILFQKVKTGSDNLYRKYSYFYDNLSNSIVVSIAGTDCAEDWYKRNLNSKVTFVFTPPDNFVYNDKSYLKQGFGIFTKLANKFSEITRRRLTEDDLKKKKFINNLVAEEAEKLGNYNDEDYIIVHQGFMNFASEIFREIGVKCNEDDVMICNLDLYHYIWMDETSSRIINELGNKYNEAIEKNKTISEKDKPLLKFYYDIKKNYQLNYQLKKQII